MTYQVSEILRITKAGHGYQWAVVGNHPNSDPWGRVYLHRIVVENHLGRLLTNEEVVHHIDGDKSNNDISNLQVMTLEDHTRHHSTTGSIMVETKCPKCDTIFTIPAKASFKYDKRLNYNVCSKGCATALRNRIRRWGVSKELQADIDNSVLRIYHDPNARLYTVEKRPPLLQRTES